MMRLLGHAVILLSVLLLSLTGCKKVSTPNGMPKLVPCQIIIKQGGTPLAGATVILEPESGVSQWSAGGTTNDAGAADIYTLGQYAGLVSGKYKVLVSKKQYDVPPPNLTQDQQMTWKSKPAVDLVEAKFSKAATTPLLLDTDSLTGKQVTFEVNPAK